MPSRYSGICHFRYSGDLAKCPTYNTLGRSVMGKADELFGNQKQYTWKRTFFDDIEIRVQLTLAGDRFIFIYVPTSGGEIKPVNGLAVGARVFFSVDSDGNRAFVNFYDRDDGIIPSATVASSMTDDHMYRPPDSLYGREIFMRTPGKYTGEMRKVIQALISQGEYIPYDYKASDTYGITTSVVSGKKWVIKISNKGIGMIPLPVKTPHNTFFDWLGYTPDGKSQGFIFEKDSNYVELVDASIVADFYNKTEPFVSCGWAFSSSGSEIQNCCYTGGDATGELSVGYRYKITIVETLLGGELKPTSAIMTLEESGQFALPRYYGMKVPNFDETKLAQTFHQDGQELLSGNWSAPRYVYYNGDVPVVVRSKGSSSETTDGDVFDWTYPFYSRGSLAAYTVSVPRFKNEYGTYYFKVGQEGTITKVLHGTVVDGYTVGQNIGGSSMEEWISWYTASSIAPIGADGVGRPQFDLYDNLGEMRLLNGDFKEHVSYCIIPLYEREAVYQYQWDLKKTNSNWATMRESMAFRFGCNNDPVGQPEGCTLIETLGYEVGYFNDQYSEYIDVFYPGAPMPVVDEVWCRTSPVAPYFDYEYGDGLPDEINTVFSLVASGGVHEILWTDNDTNYYITGYNGDPDIDNPQWMTVHMDTSQIGKLFGSKVMYGTTGNDLFSFNIDEEKYPIKQLNTTVNNTFWVGDPHCLLNNCEE